MCHPDMQEHIKHTIYKASCANTRTSRRNPADLKNAEDFYKKTARPGIFCRSGLSQQIILFVQIAPKGYPNFKRQFVNLTL